MRRFVADIVIGALALGFAVFAAWLLHRELERRAGCAASLRPGTVIEIERYSDRRHWPTRRYAEVGIEAAGSRVTVEVGGGSARLFTPGTILDLCLVDGRLDLAARRAGFAWAIGAAGLALGMVLGLVASWILRRDSWLGGAALFCGILFPAGGFLVLRLADEILSTFADVAAGSLRTAQVDLPHWIAVLVSALAAVVGFVSLVPHVRPARRRRS
jgi:hypothetical protein